jgi:hypothetical protein
MNERRLAQRRRMLKLGTINFDQAGITCMVRNLSEKGACLEVASPVGIPDEFALSVDYSEARQRCRVTWRSADRIGVLFIQA